MQDLSIFQKEVANGDYELGGGGLFLPKSKVSLGGIFTHSLYREGELVDVQSDPNIVVNEGLDYILSSSIANGTAIGTWYIGIFKNNYTPVATDVGTLFPGAGVANEANTEYDEATRPTYVVPAPASQAVTNSASPAVFTINTTVSIYGAHVQSTSTKASATGTLLAASLFVAVRNLLVNDVLNITYAFQAQDV